MDADDTLLNGTGDALAGDQPTIEVSKGSVTLPTMFFRGRNEQLPQQMTGRPAETRLTAALTGLREAVAWVEVLTQADPAQLTALATPAFGDDAARHLRALRGHLQSATQ